MTFENKTRIVSKMINLEVLKKYSPAQLRTLTNDFEESVVCQILCLVQVPDCDGEATLQRQAAQQQILTYIKEAWQECHSCQDSLGHVCFDSVMPEYLSDYEIVLISGEEITACDSAGMEQEMTRCEKLEAENRLLKDELADANHQLEEIKELSIKMADKTAQEMDKLIFKFLQHAKKKNIKKRGYIKMTLMELVNSAKYSLSDETQQLLDEFDDDVVSMAKDAADDYEAILAYARLHPLAPYVYVASKAKAVITWLQNEVNTEAKAKEQLAPIRAAFDYSVIRKDTPFDTVKKELGLTVSEESFKNWVKGSRPKDFVYDDNDLSGYYDQIRGFMQS